MLSLKVAPPSCLSPEGGWADCDVPLAGTIRRTAANAAVQALARALGERSLRGPCGVSVGLRRNLSLCHGPPRSPKKASMVADDNEAHWTLGQY